MMLIRFFRQTVFVLAGTLFRLPILGLLWILGKLRLIRTIFQVYPTDETETQGFCPNIKPLRNFFSARPTLGGLITDGIRPIGIYVVVPNTAQEIVQRGNSILAQQIVERLKRLHHLTNAVSVGLAGQLGIIFEQRHKIPIEPPLYNSLYGTIFSLSETIEQAIQRHLLPHNSATIAILGMGIYRQALQDHLEEKGHHTIPIDLQYTRSGRMKIRHLETVTGRLEKAHVLVNLLPTGIHFLQTNCHTYISRDCIIVDFARPGIPATIPHTRYMGNRVQHKGIRFLLSLPGDWKRHHIPACSLASLLALRQKPTWKNFTEFSKEAKKQRFFISLE